VSISPPTSPGLGWVSRKRMGELKKENELRALNPLGEYIQHRRHGFPLYLVAMCRRELEIVMTWVAHMSGIPSLLQVFFYTFYYI
jgi:hypothetical protein